MLRILLATIVSLPCALAVEVTSLADAGSGSLRQALAGGKVRFDPRLAGKTILITKPLELGDGAQVEIDASAAPGVTVSAGGACRILVAGGRTHVSITGLAFAQGRSSGTQYTDGGGAIFLGGQGTLTLKGCTFRDNLATGYGCAAIYAHWKHTTLIEDCTFISNDSWGCVGSERGAAAIGTGSFGSLTIRRSTFTGNKAAIGTINCMLSELLIEDSVFVGNLTEPKSGFGGAIYTDGASGLIDDEVGGTIALRRCRFEDNVGASEGGAAFLFGYRKDAIVVERCLFRSNRVEVAAVAKPGVAMGGALRIGSKATPYTITDSVFIGNRSAALGGAIWAQETEPSRITNCLFDGNTAVDMGGAISLTNEGPLAIERCTIALPLAKAPAKPVKNAKESAAKAPERPRQPAQGERMAALAKVDPTVLSREAAVEALRQALLQPGVMRSVRWKSPVFGDCDVVGADAGGLTVVAFGSETALPWTRLSDAELLAIAQLPIVRAGAAGMTAWLHLALHAGMTQNDAGVMRVVGELLNADRVRFDDYTALCTRLRG